MTEKTFFTPHIVKARIKNETSVGAYPPLDRFWKYTLVEMSWEDKRTAAIGDDCEMANLYEGYSDIPTDYIVYRNRADLERQLRRFAHNNDRLLDVPFASIGGNVGDGVIDIYVIDATDIELTGYDYALGMEGDKAICLSVTDEEDHAELLESMREFVEELEDELSGFAWELFPSRLGQPDLEVLAYALLRANARAKARQGLTEEHVRLCAFGLMAEEESGLDVYESEDERGEAYDLFAEGLLAVGNHLGLNKFFA